jgi:acyl-CoA thioesterase I
MATGQSPNDNILLLGDSLSAAHNIAIDQSWPVLFEKQLHQNGVNLTLVNASISGETSEGGKQRLPELLTKYNPRYLIIELGGNDGLRGYPFKQTQENLSQMIQMAHRHDVQVLMIGVRLPPNLGPVYNQRFQQTYQQVVDQFKLAYLPRFLEGVAASKPEYMQEDGIHPTAIAQPILARKVLQKFLSIFKT